MNNWNCCESEIVEEFKGGGGFQFASNGLLIPRMLLSSFDFMTDLIES